MGIERFPYVTKLVIYLAVKPVMTKRKNKKRTYTVPHTGTLKKKGKLPLTCCLSGFMVYMLWHTVTVQYHVTQSWTYLCVFFLLFWGHYLVFQQAYVECIFLRWPPISFSIGVCPSVKTATASALKHQQSLPLTKGWAKDVMADAEEVKVSGNPSTNISAQKRKTQTKHCKQQEDVVLKSEAASFKCNQIYNIFLSLTFRLVNSAFLIWSELNLGVPMWTKSNSQQTNVTKQLQTWD